jgi:hypothetical protein
MLVPMLCATAESDSRQALRPSCQAVGTKRKLSEKAKTAWLRFAMLWLHRLLRRSQEPQRYGTPGNYAQKCSELGTWCKNVRLEYWTS